MTTGATGALTRRCTAKCFTGRVASGLPKPAAGELLGRCSRRAGIEQSPGQTSMKASAAAVASPSPCRPLFLPCAPCHPPELGVRASSSFPRGRQGQGGVWGGQRARAAAAPPHLGAGAGWRLALGRAAALPAGSEACGGPSEPGAPPCRPPRPAGKPLPPERRVNAAVPSRSLPPSLPAPTPPITSPHTTPLSQGLPCLPAGVTMETSPEQLPGAPRRRRERRWWPVGAAAAAARPGPGRPFSALPQGPSLAAGAGRPDPSSGTGQPGASRCGAAGGWLGQAGL